MSEASHIPDFDELLRHESFVRALARSLVHGEDRAEDATQDVWVAAMRSPPAQSVNLRGWLGAVLRNAVRMGHRSSSRRRARESAVSAPAHAPSAQEVAAKIEVRRLLVDAVESLAEPYRSVVVLRYFDGLRPVEISRRLGVPAKTVGTRLRRALEQLRSRLDREDRPGRAGWRALILASPLAASGAQAATLTGAVLMSVKLKLALAVLVLCVISVAVWKGLDGPGGEPPALPAAAAEESESEPEADPPPLAASDEPASPPPAAADPVSDDWALSVEVRDPAGGPAGGARVSFRATEVWKDRTGKDGRARLEVSGGGDLAVSGVDGATPKLVTGLAPPASGSRCVRVVLERGLSIHGVLMDRLGAPLSGVRLRCRAFSRPTWAPRREWKTARTGERGEFEVWGLLPGRHEFLFAPPQSAGETPDPRVEANAGDRNIVVALRPLEWPVLRLLDRKTGEFLGVSAQVYIISKGRERPIWGMLEATEAKLPGIRPGDVRVRVEAEGYLSLEPFDLDPGDSDLIYDVFLDRDPYYDARMARLTLQIHDDTGKALERVAVSGHRSGYSRQVLTLEGGAVSIELGARQHVLDIEGVDADGKSIFDLEKGELTLGLRPGEHAERSVVLRRMGTVLAEVPERGYTITVLRADGSSLNVGYGIRTGEERLRVVVLPGSWILRATYGDGTKILRPFTVKAGETIELSLLPTEKPR